MVNEKQIEDAAAAVKVAEDKARSEGAKAERARIAAINAALPEAWAEAARGKAVADGLDAARAESLALAGARAEITRLRGEATERDKKLAAIAAGGVKPLEQKAGDDQAEARAKAKAAETAKDPAGQFDAQVADLTRDGKTSKAAAQLRIAAERPDLHQAWLARANAPRL